MSRTFRTFTLAIGAALLVAPTLAVAQGGRGFPGAPPRGEGPVAGRGVGPGGVTRLLNARRELDLTSRQVAQLDSIERLQHAERKAFQERMRPVRDSLLQRARPGQGTGQRTPALRDSLQAQARARREAARPQMEQMRKRDSSLNASAERVLNDTQRQKVREMQAERRGYARGMRAGRGQRGGTPQAGQRSGATGGRALQGGRGGMSGQQGAGQGGRQGGQFGPQGGVRGPQGPGGTGGRGGMPPRRPPMPDEDGR